MALWHSSKTPTRFGMIVGTRGRLGRGTSQRITEVAGITRELASPLRFCRSTNRKGSLRTQATWQILSAKEWNSNDMPNYNTMHGLHDSHCCMHLSIWMVLMAKWKVKFKLGLRISGCTLRFILCKSCKENFSSNVLLLGNIYVFLS